MASLYVIRGKDKGQHFALRGVSSTLGREATNQIQLRDTEVSRRHARITRISPNAFEIVDTNSSNGTFVNGRRVTMHALKSGDRVQLGRSLMIFTGGADLHSTHAIDSVEIVAQDDNLSQIRSSLQSHSSLAKSTSSHSPLPTSELHEARPDSAAGSSTGSSQRREPATESSAKEKPSADAGEIEERFGPTVTPDGSSLEPQRPTPEDAARVQDGSSRLSKETGLDIVYQVSQAMYRTVEINDLLNHVLHLIFEHVECDRGCILMMDDEEDVLRPIASLDRKNKSASNTPEPTKQPLTISRSILEHVCETKVGVLTSNAQNDERWERTESVARLGVHEAICVPMQGRYGFVGAIYVDTSMTPGAYVQRTSPLLDNEHLKLMMAIAGQAALAIEDTQFYRAMMQSERLAVMGNTIANLSHHIKNILQGVSGGEYLLEDGLKKQDLDVVSKGWALVKRNQDRISTLVMDMLSFSKEREPDLTQQNLNSIVEEVIELMKPRAELKSVALEWEDNSPELVCEFDKEGIHRALLNIVSNAMLLQKPSKVGSR